MTPALATALDRIERAAATGDDGWFDVILWLAWDCDGPLRERLLDGIGAALSCAPARRWLRIDEHMRSFPFSGLWSEWPGEPKVSWDARRGRCVVEQCAWRHLESLDAIRAALGPHVAVLLLATTHANGHVREAAVRALAGDARGIPALLVRANDWVGAVRDAAVATLNGLAEPEHVGSWIRAMSLLVRLEGGCRSSDAALIDRVGSLFRNAAAQEDLLAAIRTLDAPSASAAASMAIRLYGNSDRRVVAAMLGCRDTRVRFRAVDPSSSALDGDLLERALHDPVPGIRRRALEVVRVRRPTEFVARLRSACFDRSAVVRDYAVFHLRKSGALDAAGLAAEARERIASGRCDLLGALGLLSELDDATPGAEARALAAHPRGRVRLSAKRWLIRALGVDGPVDPLLADDPSPKIARRLISSLRTLGVEPDAARVARRVAESTSDVEARAWLGTLAAGGDWAALPHLVRAMDDPRDAVAAAAWEHVSAATKRTFRSYVDPGPGRLADLAAALHACRSDRAAAVIPWVRAVTGRRDWPATGTSGGPG